MSNRMVLNAWDLVEQQTSLFMLSVQSVLVRVPLVIGLTI